MKLRMHAKRDGNDILFHVFCNQSSHRCECLPDFPVNVEDTVCAKALSLGQRCEYDASCKWMDKYSECAKEEQRCRCMGNYMPKVNLTHGTSCVQSKGIYSLPDYHDLLTLLIIILLSLLLIILTFIAYKLCKKNSTLNVHSLGRRSKLTDDNQFGRNEDAASPFVLLDEQPHSKPESSNASSDSNLSKAIENLDPPLPPFRSVSMRSVLDAVPSMHCNNSLNFLQRRPSLSSIQSSFRSYRSYSSFRSNSPYRNFKQIFTNFKRSNNVRSTSDNLCESILVKQPPDAFQAELKYEQPPPPHPFGHCNGQRPVRTTHPNRTPDAKLTESKRAQHLLNNHHLHHAHHLTKDLNSHYHVHHHPNHHHSNHQLNHHLAHHYGKDFVSRPVICAANTPGMAAVSTQTIHAATLDPPPSSLNPPPNPSLNPAAAAQANPSVATTNFLAHPRTDPRTDPRTGGASNQSANSSAVHNILANSVIHNNNVLKKCTKINDETFAS